VPGTEQTDGFAVSPNANQIAFRVNAADDWESGGCRAQNLFISNSDGSNRILLTSGAPLYCVEDLRWSRDGSWVWFRADDEPDADRENDLYGVPRSGEGLAVLVGPSGAVLSEPVELAATPNGPRLLFVADVSGDADVYTMAPDGSEIRNLTDNEAEDWDPSWSPDGTYIAFSSDRDGNAEIYRMTAMGTGVRRLTAHSATDRTATWLSRP
jgi:Tol biopolymer transport system component